MSLGFLSNHAALHALGATIVTSTDFETSYAPDNLDISGLAAAVLAAAKASKKKQLQAVYDLKMSSGFTSSALGAAYIYATDDDRKAILTAGALRAFRGLTQNYYCTDVATGIGAIRAHTPAQMLQVLDNAEAIAQAYLSNLLAKTAAVTTAATEAEINAISW